MRILIRKLLAPMLTKERREKLKRREYNIRRYAISKLPEITEEGFSQILRERLGIVEGSHIFVHGSLDMVNTKVTPLRLAEMLIDLVGRQGSVSVPTFIRYTSLEWMQMDKPFHVLRTPSGMGLLSERIRRYSESKRSIHPTRSVATVGKIADEVLSEHHLSDYPFGPCSPFVKLLNHDVKIVGLGVPMSYLSMVHTVEDSNPELFPVSVNLPDVYEKTCVTADGGRVAVKTRVHDPRIVVKANPERFVRRCVPRSAFCVFRHYMTPFFAVEGKQLYLSLEEQMRRGRTIYD